MAIESQAIESLRARLRGELLHSGDDGYDAARTIWNDMIDRRPRLIVRCRGAADAMEAVRFARAHDLVLAVRGGGHNVAGNAVCDDGLMIDFSAMKSVHVDPVARTARVEPGVTWAEINHETQAFGLAVTGGTVSHTGVAGLTLGGGIGWLSALQGHTCDNLLSADLITATGERVRASATGNADLLWALKGGGGNFGVVTSFEFQLHPVNPEVFGGMVAWPFANAREVLKFYAAQCADCPDELVLNAGILHTPDGQHVVAIIGAWLGDVAEAQARFAPIRSFGAPVADMMGPVSYSALNMLLDGGTPFGLPRYWKSGYFAEVGEELIERIVAHAGAGTSPLSSVLLFRIAGAATRIPADATAFSVREPVWDFDIIAQWERNTPPDTHIDWVRRFWGEVEPFSHGVYVNHLDADETSSARVRAAYGSNYARLAALKREWDPTNFFHMNNNIPPA